MYTTGAPVIVLIQNAAPEDHRAVLRNQADRLEYSAGLGENGCLGSEMRGLQQLGSLVLLTGGWIRTDFRRWPTRSDASVEVC